MVFQGENCIDAIYETTWEQSHNLQFRSDMLVLLSQRPFTFQATGMMFVNFEKFTMVRLIH